MNKLLCILSIILALAAAGCHNDVYDEMPESIQKFISQYYPNPSIGNYLFNGKTYNVTVISGPTFNFDSEMKWTSINGNGMPLVQELLFDQLPSPLYEYLQQTESLDQVFAIRRTNDTYTVQLIKSTVKYDVATGKITQTEDTIK